VLASEVGWSWNSIHNGLGGLGWCWGTDDEGAFTKGVHLCAKMVCVDACIEDVTKDGPLLVCLTGDAARVSFRGAIIATCGAKEVDRRLPSQMGAGKVMNQSRNTCTPMLAGCVSENVPPPPPS
jgi:hypothetical protein